MTQAPPQTLCNTSAALCLVEELYRQGCPGVVVCPGSRSTPLVAAFAHFAALPVRILHDERSAGFFALGWARATGRPIAVVTTSGTAVANLLPAFVEADRDRVPLLALTADRPFECHGTDANQTVNQRIFLQSVARRVINLAPPEDLHGEDELIAHVRAAYRAAVLPIPGPVQLNCMFRKPLEPEAKWLARERTPPQREEGEIATAWNGPRLGEAPDPATMRQIAARLRESDRGVVLLGATQCGTEAQGAHQLAEHLGWPLIASALSNIRSIVPPDLDGRDAACITQAAILAKAQRLPPPPDTVVWLGGPMLFPELSEYAAQGRYTLRIDPYQRPRSERLAPDALLTCTTPEFIAALATQTPSPQIAWTSTWRKLQDIAVAEASSALFGDVSCSAAPGTTTPPSDLASPDAPLDEPTIAAMVAQSLPPGGALFIGNSMPIRDIELFCGARRDAMHLFANRGASGIDGLLSTAAGIACHARRLVALLGDLSFLHDVGVCSALGRSEIPLRVVVVENGGGGIFDFLPIAAHRDLLDPYFYTPHHVDLGRLMAAYGIPCSHVSTRQELWTALKPPPTRFEIVVANSTRDQNVHAHQMRYRSLQNAIDACAMRATGGESR